MNCVKMEMVFNLQNEHCVNSPNILYIACIFTGLIYVDVTHDLPVHLTNVQPNHNLAAVLHTSSKWRTSIDMAIVLAGEAKNRGSIPGRTKDHLWDPSRVLRNGYGRLFS